MQEVLAQKLARHLRDHHPDLEIKLQQADKLTAYIADKISGIEPLLDKMLRADTPAYLIETICMDRLIAGLPPSRTDFIHTVLLREFEKEYEAIDKAGVLYHEILNILSTCSDVFDDFGFSYETEDDPVLYSAITGAVKEHFKQREG